MTTIERVARALAKESHQHVLGGSRWHARKYHAPSIVYSGRIARRASCIAGSMKQGRRMDLLTQSGCYERKLRDLMQRSPACAPHHYPLPDTNNERR